MVIGACENCRYTDLIEGDLDVCPRCGSVIVSLGVDSAKWNKLSYPEKKTLVEMKFSRRKILPDPEPVADPAPEPVAISAVIPEEKPLQYNKNLNEYVYACFNCDSIASHESEDSKYYCPDCGSDMMWTGFTVYEWGKLSIRAKRNAMENAKIRYIESKIKKTDFKSS